MKAYKQAVQYIAHSNPFELRFNFNGGLKEGSVFHNTASDVLIVEKVIKLDKYECRYLVSRIMTKMPVQIRFFIWWIKTIKKLKSIKV
tara:strand:+ start:143 stop:406 length:264 start_codon:yes stop_codon:yes gene_type:complete